SDRAGPASTRPSWSGSSASALRRSRSTRYCPKRSSGPSRRLRLRRHAAFHPPAERGDLFLGPLAVAGHAAVLHPLEDSRSVVLDVLVAPQVERPLHPGSVLVPEHLLDVPLVPRRC